MPRVQVGNVKLFFEIYGSELDLSGPLVREKPTLIFLHGGPGLDHCYEAPILAPIQEEVQLIFLNHRGNGRSEGEDPAEWNLRQWAEDLHGFCCALDLVKPFICGVSFGGHVALQYATLFPDTLAGLVLYDTEGYFSRDELLAAYDPEAARIAKAFLDDPNDATCEAFSKACLPSMEGYFRHCIHRNEVAYASQGEFDLLPDLHKIESPILYLASRNNPLHRLEAAERTAAHFAPGQVTFKSFETELLALDAPDALREEIIQFVCACGC